jgi:glycosyltransferase involved in cell wall biosynthesis
VRGALVIPQEPARIDIGLPVFNGEKYVAQAIESIRAQTFNGWRLVICDNASTDATERICREFAAQDPRIEYRRNPVNVGLYPNFEVAFNAGRATYFKFHAHDDLCAPNFLEEAIRSLEANPKAVLAYSKPRVIDGEGNVIAALDWEDGFAPANPDPGSRFMALSRGMRDSTSPAPTYMFGVFRRALIPRRCLRTTNLRAHDSLLAEMALRGPFVRTPDGLFTVRLDGTNSSVLDSNWNPMAWQKVLDGKGKSGIGTRVSAHMHHLQYLRAVTTVRGLSPRQRVATVVEYSWEIGGRKVRRVAGKLRVPGLRPGMSAR